MRACVIPWRGKLTRVPLRSKSQHHPRDLPLPFPPSQQPELNLFHNERSDRFSKPLHRPEAWHVSLQIYSAPCLHPRLGRPCCCSHPVNVYTLHSGHIASSPVFVSFSPFTVLALRSASVPHAFSLGSWLTNGFAPAPACARRSRSSSRRTTQRPLSPASFFPSPRVLKARPLSLVVMGVTGTLRSHN